MTPNYISRLHFHVNRTRPWLLKYNSSEFDCFCCFFLTLSYSYVTHSVRLPLASYLLLYSICVIYGMPRRGNGHQILSNPLPREVESISRGNKYTKDIPLLSYLPYVPTKVGSIYLLSLVREYYISFLLVLNQKIISFLWCQLFFYRYYCYYYCQFILS